MATEAHTTSEAPAGPGLFVEAATPTQYPGADAVICDVPDELAEGQQSAGVIWRWSRGRELPALARFCVAEGGLVAAAGLSAGAAGLAVVPRIEVHRATRRFGFSPDSSGSGFSTYHLDPATATAFLAADGGQDVPLGDWLGRAAELGYPEVWLHSRDAAAAGGGFSHELLARAHRIAPQMRFWISGGGTSLSHFEAMAAMPGLVALVVNAANIGDLDLERVRLALRSTSPRDLPGAA